MSKPTVPFHGIDAIELRRGADRARLAPQYGGLLLDWHVGGQEVVRWPAGPTDWEKVTKVRGGNPVLFPFIARHFVDGVLGRWKDEKGVVRDLPMHGFARKMAYQVLPEGGEDSVRLRIESTPETLEMYPFPFVFEVAYRLAGDGVLEVELATTNTGSAPLPYYAGHHFYLNIPHAERPAWTLEFPFEKTGMRKSEEGGEVVFGPAPEASSTLDNPALIDRFQIGPKRNRFSLRHQDGRTIEFDLAPRETVPWHTVTTWSETPTSDFYCVEPWLGLPDAIHHEGYGLRHVAPGATERAVCALRYRAA
ncbi:MAG: hypothetical protein PW734_07635 [Verrucomicrobium sp.]|nr:hypothetical protein [Verrucomicrobium sp.]